MRPALSSAGPGITIDSLAAEGGSTQASDPAAVEVVVMVTTPRHPTASIPAHRLAGVLASGLAWLEAPPQLISREIAGTGSRKHVIFTEVVAAVVVAGVRDPDQVRIPAQGRLRLRDTRAQVLGPQAEDEKEYWNHLITSQQWKITERSLLVRTSFLTGTT